MIEDQYRIGDIEESIVIRVRFVQISRLQAAHVQSREHVDRICGIDFSIVVRITAENPARVLIEPRGPATVDIFDRSLDLRSITTEEFGEVVDSIRTRHQVREQRGEISSFEDPGGKNRLVPVGTSAITVQVNARKHLAIVGDLRKTREGAKDHDEDCNEQLEVIVPLSHLSSPLMTWLSKPLLNRR